MTTGALKRLAAVVGAVALAACQRSCTSCGSAQPPPAGAAAPGAFPAGSARLAAVPAGWELGDALASPDGRRAAFVIQREGKAKVVVDGAAGPLLDGARELLFLEGAAGFAYAAQVEGKEVVVVDGKEGPRFDVVGQLRAGPGGQVLHSGVRAGAWSVVLGAREVAAPGAADPAPAVTGDGRWVVWVQQQAGSGRANLRACGPDLGGCLDGEPGDAILDLRASPEGAEVAYTAQAGGRLSLVRASIGPAGIVAREIGSFDEVEDFDWAPRGGHLAAIVRQGEQQLLLRGGALQRLAEPFSPMGMKVSAKGRVLVAAIIGSGVTVLLDGQGTGKSHRGVAFPTFSPDGEGQAWVAEEEAGGAVVVNGEAGPAFDRVVTPRFTPDGSKVVYRARRAGARFVVVADARGRTLREHPAYQAVYEVSISPDGSRVAYLARAGDDLWLEVEPL